MSDGGYAVWVSLASLFVSVSTGIWSVVSWRRAGSHLRVHALLYREVLLLWVFNAGRVADRVEEVVIGGRRGGIGGASLTEVVGGGFSLGPGESRRIELDWRMRLPVARHTTLEGGFDSVWLLLGSMRQKRAEVLALPQRRPPEVGWRLAPRGANMARYVPLAFGLPLLLVSDLASRNPTDAAMVGILVMFGVAVWTVFTPGFRSQRRKIERRYIAFGTLILTALALAEPQWMASGYPFALYLSGALVVGWPGWLPVALDARRMVRTSVQRVGASSSPDTQEQPAQLPSDREPAEPAP
jgi:hypothetical protein